MSVRVYDGWKVSGASYSCQEEANGDAELVGADNGTSDPFRSRLRLIERD